MHFCKLKRRNENRRGYLSAKTQMEEEKIFLRIAIPEWFEQNNDYIVRGFSVTENKITEFSQRPNGQIFWTHNIYTFNRGEFNKFKKWVGKNFSKMSCQEIKNKILSVAKIAPFGKKELKDWEKKRTHEFNKRLAFLQKELKGKGEQIDPALREKIISAAASGDYDIGQCEQLFDVYSALSFEEQDKRYAEFMHDLYMGRR